MFKCQRIFSPLAAGAKAFAVLLAMAALPALTLGQISVRVQADPAKPGAAADKSADEKLIKEIEARIAELNKQLQESKARKQAADAPKKAPPPAKVQGWIIELNEKNFDVKPKLEGVRKKLEVILNGVSSGERKSTEAPKKLEPKKTGVLVFDGVFDLQLEAAPASHVIPLSRATYHLPKDKAEALAAFLKAHVKTSVLELKVEEHGLTITTAPEAQTAIGNFVKLLQGPRAHTFQLHFGRPEKK